MSRTTTDPTDPDLTRGFDKPGEPVEQAKAYLVLSQEERDKGFVRPFRDSYIHEICGTVTRMSHDIAATYARDPTFYGGTYCMRCQGHFPVAEFTWDKDGERVGS